MRLLKRWFSFYVNSSIHVAIAVTALAIITEIEFALEINKALLIFIFFGTICAYNFVKFGSDSPSRKHWFRVPMPIFVFSIISAGAFLYFALKLHLNALMVSLFLGILTLLYTIPIFRATSFRNFPNLKIFVVGLVWAGATVALPLSENMSWSIDWFWPTILQRFLFVLALTLPFEIRDLEYDSKAMKTIPQQLGIRATKGLGALLLVASVVIEFCKNEFLLWQSFGLLIACLLVLISLMRANKNQSTYFASFWVEGIPIIWCSYLVLTINL